MNIFTDIMDANEFTMDIADKIAADYKALDEGDPNTVYNWIRTRFADTLAIAVKRRIEG